MAKLEEEKKTIDSRVEANRYAFIAQREKDYMVVEEDFKRVNKFLNEKIEGVRQYERDMYDIQPDYEKVLFKDVFSVV